MRTAATDRDRQLQIQCQPSAVWLGDRLDSGMWPCNEQFSGLLGTDRSANIASAAYFVVDTPIELRKSDECRKGFTGL